VSWTPPPVSLLRHEDFLAPPGDQDDPSSLPVPLSSFVGREPEVAALSALLRDPGTRLVTLTGVGGVGKTRLSLRAAANLDAENRFADGVVFVELASVRDPDLVAPVIAQMLGVRGVGQEPAVATLKTFLQNRHLLLVLDNFEQVSEAGPILIELLSACPNLTILVTSRSLLNLSGEQAMPVPPLSLGLEEGGRETGDIPHPPSSDAVRLFVARTGALNPAFTLSPVNEPIIAEIVQRLDGLPLAIELAAARGALLPPSALLARLDRPLPHLTGGPPDQPARHRTMRAAIVWSYELLTPEEQRVFRALGVFAGGGTLEAAESICAVVNDADLDVAGGADPDVLATLNSLVDQSLVQSAVSSEDDARDDTSRVTMLGTIREFATEQLLEWGEHTPARRHAEFHLTLAARAEPAYWGDAPGDWRAAIDREAGNLRAAFDWMIARGETDLALRMVSSRFDPHWTTGASAHVHRRWAKQALSMPGGSPAARGRALTAAAWLAHVHDDFAEGRALAGEALALAHQIGDALGAASASFVLGVAAFHEGHLDAARGHLDDALAGFRELAAPGRTAWTLSYLASLDSRAAIDEGGDPATLARAVSLYEEALALFREAGNAHGLARALHGLAYVAWKQRDLPRALALSRDVLHLDWEQRWPIYYHLEDIADIAGRLGAPAVAARLYGAADSLRERAGRPVEPVFRDEFERDVAVARRALGDEAFAQAWAAGRALSPAQAIAEAEQFTAARGRPGQTDPALAGVEFAGLTLRELDVLRQLIDGRTDREIAERLFITRRTASKHVEAILSKLGVRSRGAAVAEAQRLGFA
jgi:predicted ATPase/DNA-binding CsgD family transcriptional regulator